MLTRRMFLAQSTGLSMGAVATTLPHIALPGRVSSAVGGVMQGESPAPPVAGAGSLRAHAAARGLRYGSAVDVGLLRNDAAYRRLLVEQCGIVVAESAMKWAALHPAPEHYTFDEADTLVAFAEQHGMAVRGHNLCWHEALPDWFAATVMPQNAARVLTEHIRTVAGRYKGRLRAWDVVNEAVWPRDGRADGLRNSPWLRLLGPGYIDLAFRTAREADPRALLTYNDYGIEYDHLDNAEKRAAVLQLLKRLKTAGTPIDAVGIQSHLSAGSLNPLGPGLIAFVAAVRSMGLKVFVTELDVNDDDVATGDPAARDAAVASVYRKYVSDLVANDAVTDVLTWGVSDNHSWLNSSSTHEQRHPGRQERALPFDAAYQPKPAFYALRDALDRPKT